MNLNSFLKATRERAITKAEEIEFLHHLSTIGKHTYLSSLFSQDFVEWVERQIESDCSTDMMAELQHSQRQRDNALLRANEKAAALQAHIAELQKQVEELNQAEEALTKAVGEWGVHSGKLRNQLTEAAFENDALRNKVNGLRVMAADAWAEKKVITPEQLRDALGDL